MKYYRLILFLACCTFLSCSKNETTRQRPYTLPPPVVGKSYTADEIIAFKQLTINATGNNKIAKLPAQVTVYIADTAYPYLTKEIDAVISEINTLLDKSLVIKRTSELAGASMQVYLTDRDTYIAQEPAASSALLNSNYTGYAYIFWNDNGVIYHGSVFVDMKRTVNDTLQQRHLIHHEMMHALGFLGHVTLPQLSTVLFYYAPLPYILDYTDYDKKMMKLLYHPAIKPGMNDADFNIAVANL